MPSRADIVYNNLLEEIDTGRIASGERLASETALAAAQGVSRPVIREAIARLAAAGIVRTERGRGTYVLPAPVIQTMTLSPITSIDDLIHWQELRIAIEQEAGRLAATRRSAADLAAIVAANERLGNGDADASHDVRGELDHAFHVAIAAASHNPAILDAQMSLGKHTKGWIAAILHSAPRKPDRAEYRLREHRAIIDAIERMDPEAASQAIRRHIENGRTRFLAGLSKTMVAAAP